MELRGARRLTGFGRNSMISNAFARRWSALVAALMLLGAGPTRAVTEDISFVAEHLPEVAMDNRYASLPLWSPPRVVNTHDWRFGAGVGFTDMSSGALGISGPMFDVSVEHPLGNWSLTAFAFYDDFSFSGSTDRRPLDQPFVPTPIA